MSPSERVRHEQLPIGAPAHNIGDVASVLLMEIDTIRRVMNAGLYGCIDFSDARRKGGPSHYFVAIFGTLLGYHLAGGNDRDEFIGAANFAFESSPDLFLGKDGRGAWWVDWGSKGNVDDGHFDKCVG